MEADLRLDTKEAAEHMMLVDLARNDVARVSEPGTRHVAQLMTLEKYARVMHLVCSVKGVLAKGYDALHALQACLNVGTLSGAPKLKATELLRRYERTRRGPYGGAIGWLNGEGMMDTGVVIRSALVKDGTAFVRAGAGIVHDSDPMRGGATRRAARPRRSCPRSLESRRDDPQRPHHRQSRQLHLQHRRSARAARRQRARLRNEVAAEDAFAAGAAERTPHPDLARSRPPGRCGLQPRSGRGSPKAKCRSSASASASRRSCWRPARRSSARAEPVHGKAIACSTMTATGPFAGVPKPVRVGRYHSLCTPNPPPRFHVHAAIDGMAMAISDADAKQVGVQFHPESVLTPGGQQILANVLDLLSAA